MTKDDYVIICGDFGGIWKKASANNGNDIHAKDGIAEKSM